MEDQYSIWEILRGFTHNDVLEAYLTTIKKFKVIGIGTSLGIAVGIFLFIRDSGEIVSEAIGFSKGKRVGDIDRTKIFLIFRPAIFLIGVVAFYPYVLEYIEAILNSLANSLGEYGLPDSNLRDVWSKEAIELQRQLAKTSSWELGQKVFLLVNYVLIFIIKPLFILLEQDAYSMFLMLRYMYLILLQLFGGVAIACYLSKDTRVYFYSWLKHMLFCYCMVAVFGIANFFAEETLKVFISSNSSFSYNILVIAFGLIVKLFLFKQSFNLLKSSIF